MIKLDNRLPFLGGSVVHKLPVCERLIGISYELKVEERLSAALGHLKGLILSQPGPEGTGFGNGE